MAALFSSSRSSLLAEASCRRPHAPLFSPIHGSRKLTCTQFASPDRCDYGTHVIKATSGRRRLAWRGIPSAAAKSGPMDPVVVEIPASQEQAVQEAARALLLHMRPLMNSKNSVAKKVSKGFAKKPSAGSNMFAVEIPAMDDSAGATSALAGQFAAILSPALNTKLIVVFADAKAAAAAKKSPSMPAASVVSLKDACRGDNLAGPLMVVGPKVDDVALFEQLVDDVWLGGAPLALVNAEFPAAPVPAQFTTFCSSILVVWSFLPIALGGLMDGKEGAVLRNVDKVGPAAKECTWRVVFKQSGNKFVACGQTKTRPTNEDLELAFLNASAAMSPVTSAVKSVKSLIPNFNFGKKQ